MYALLAPAASRSMVTWMRSMASASKFNLHQSVSQRYCRQCSQIYVAGSNCAIRVVRARKKRLRKGRVCKWSRHRAREGCPESGPEKGAVGRQERSKLLKPQVPQVPQMPAVPSGKQRADSRSIQRRRGAENAVGATLNRLFVRCCVCGHGQRGQSIATSTRQATKRTPHDLRVEEARRVQAVARRIGAAQAAKAKNTVGSAAKMSARQLRSTTSENPGALHVPESAELAQLVAMTDETAHLNLAENSMLEPQEAANLEPSLEANQLEHATATKTIPVVSPQTSVRVRPSELKTSSVSQREIADSSPLAVRASEPSLPSTASCVNSPTMTQSLVAEQAEGKSSNAQAVPPSGSSTCALKEFRTLEEPGKQKKRKNAPPLATSTVDALPGQHGGGYQQGRTDGQEGTLRKKAKRSKLQATLDAEMRHSSGSLSF